MSCHVIPCHVMSHSVKLYRSDASNKRQHYQRNTQFVRISMLEVREILTQFRAKELIADSKMRPDILGDASKCNAKGRHKIRLKQ